jgi:hypothetical protein
LDDWEARKNAALDRTTQVLDRRNVKRDCMDMGAALLSVQKPFTYSFSWKRERKKPEEMTTIHHSQL